MCSNNEVKVTGDGLKCKVSLSSKVPIFFQLIYHVIGQLGDCFSSYVCFVVLILSMNELAKSFHRKFTNTWHFYSCPLENATNLFNSHNIPM